VLAPSDRGASSRSAWLVVALLCPVAFLNYLDRQMLASMKLSVMADIPGLASESDWGLMLGQFKWVYALLGPIGGFVADRWSRRYTISGSLLVWSGVTWWTGHVRSYPELLAARSLLGISEAFYIPAALALIAEAHADRSRSRAVGVHQMAIYGGVIAGGFAGYAADAPGVGWRMAFDACGALGMLYALPLGLLLRDPPDPKGSPRAEAVSPRRAGTGLVSNPAFLLLVLYFTLPAMAAWIIRDWLPAILIEKYAIGQGKAGVAATLAWQLAAIGGVCLGGWMADRWARWNPRGRIYTSALGTSLIVPAILGVGNAGSLAAAVWLLVLFGLGWGFFDCNNMPILCQVVRPELRATAYGLMNLVSISAGGAADLGFGVLRDLRIPLGVVFGAFSSIAILSIPLVLLIRPRKDFEEARGSEANAGR
jgi:MFS family permease